MSNSEFVVSMKFQAVDQLSPEIKKIADDMKQVTTATGNAVQQAKKLETEVTAIGGTSEEVKKVSTEMNLLVTWLDESTTSAKEVQSAVSAVGGAASGVKEATNAVGQLDETMKQANQQAKAAKKSLDSLGSGPSGGKFKWLDDLSSGLDTVSKKLKGIPDKFDKMKSSGLSTMLTGGAVVAPVMKALNSAGQFQLGMTTIDMSTGASQAQDEAIQKAIRDSSLVTKFSTSEVQDIAIKEATSGLTADQITQLTPEMTKFAEVQNFGKGSSPDEAVTQAISASHMLGIYDPKQLNDFLNSFNKMTFMSPGSTSEFFDTFKYLSPTAKAMGLSNDDILYTAALSNRVGMLGSMGGTESADLIMRSIPGIFGGMGHTDSKGRFKPSQQLKAMMDLGLAQADGSSVFFDNTGKFKGIQNFIDQLADASKNVNPEQFTKDLKEMFGTQGMRLADIFSERGGEQLKVIQKQAETMKSIDDFQSGYNKDFFQQLEQFESNVGNLTQKIGADLLPAATNFLNELEHGVSVASVWVDSHKQEVITIGKAAAEVGGFLLAVGAAKLAVGALGTFISPITKLGGSMADLMNQYVIKPIKDSLNKKTPEELAPQTIKANVVNVYGTEVNGGGGGGGINVDGVTGEKTKVKGKAGAVVAGAEEVAEDVAKSGAAKRTAGKVFSVAAAGVKGLAKGIKGAAPLAVITGAIDVATAPEGQKLKTAATDTGGAIGGWAGAAAGAEMGAAIGSVVPGIGTAIGAALGGIIGGIAGSELGSHLTSSLYDWINNKMNVPAPLTASANSDYGVNSVSRAIQRKETTPENSHMAKAWQLAQQDQQINVHVAPPDVHVSVQLSDQNRGNYSLQNHYSSTYGAGG